MFSHKSIIYLCLFLGTTIGSFVPALWGAGLFSYSSLILSGLGGLLGIYIALKYL